MHRKTTGWIVGLAIVAIALVIYADGVVPRRSSSSSSRTQATSVPAQGSRSNPFRTGFHAVRDGRFRANGIELNADRHVEQMNMFNPSPERGEEWVLVDVTFDCALDADETCVTGRMYFELVGDRGEIYSDQRFATLDNQFGDEVFGGGQEAGVIGFMVNEADSDFLFVVRDGSDRTFFTIPED